MVRIHGTKTTNGKTERYSVERNTATLRESLYLHEAMLVCYQTPTCLGDTVSMAKSNYDAMRCFTLGEEATAQSTSNQSSNHGQPTHCFYFFTSPVEYFLTITRYAVLQWNQLQSKQQSMGSKTDKMLTRKIEDFSIIIEVRSINVIGLIVVELIC